MTLEQTKLLFRPLEEKDHPQAAALAAGVWRFDQLIADPQAAALAREAFFRYYLSRQNYTEAALRGGELLGILFGHCAALPLPPEHSAQEKAAENAAERLLSMPEGRRFRTAMERNSACEKRLLASFEGEFDAELVLFVTAPAARGLGIGKELLARFNQFLVQNGARRPFLLTDTLCNYGFYDHLGFRRLAETEGLLGIEPDGKPMHFFLYGYEL